MKLVHKSRVNRHPDLVTFLRHKEYTHLAEDFASKRHKSLVSNRLSASCLINLTLSKRWLDRTGSQYENTGSGEAPMPSTSSSERLNCCWVQKRLPDFGRGRWIFSLLGSNKAKAVGCWS